MNAFQQRKDRPIESLRTYRYTVFTYRQRAGGGEENKMQVKRIRAGQVISEARNMTGNGKWGQEKTLAQQKGGSFKTMRDKRRILIALDTNNVIGLPGQ